MIDAKTLQDNFGQLSVCVDWDQAKRDMTGSTSHPFAHWNIGDRIRTRNCYAFAGDAYAPDLEDIFRLLRTNDATSSVSFELFMPGPGTMGGRLCEDSFSGPLREAVVSDGFIYVPTENYRNIEIPKDHYLIAGYCNPVVDDYHFYRYHEPTGDWYHKPGWGNPVTNLDKRSNVIRDPQTAARGMYNDFIGFFLSPPSRPAFHFVVRDTSKKVVLDTSCVPA